MADAQTRIINETETATFANDDYLIVDSASLGTRKISKSVVENLISFSDDGNGNITITTT